ncbi:hypothetical protein [Pantoea piersonii]|uniref:hypothetical protein n=1 Tax=Pantoea piersonii TaxID=2364647 RepID=UPI00289A4E01|nr:hypothetical protein [Pantoea piersonii]
MITTDYPQDLKQKLSDAVACSFASCLREQEYRVVTCAIVEFLTALDMTQEEVREVLLKADGMDADTDRCIDDINDAFCD